MVAIDKGQVLALDRKITDEQKALLRSLPEGFGVRLAIQDLRKRQGLTLQKLGDRMGTSLETALRLESGKLPLNYKWLLLAAAALGVEPMALFSALEIRDENERRLLESYRTLGAGDQDRLVSIANAFAGPSEARATGTDENIYERSDRSRQHYLNDK